MTDEYSKYKQISNSHIFFSKFWSPPNPMPPAGGLLAALLIVLLKENGFVVIGRLGLAVFERSCFLFYEGFALGLQLQKVKSLSLRVGNCLLPPRTTGSSADDGLGRGAAFRVLGAAGGSRKGCRTSSSSSSSRIRADSSFRRVTTAASGDGRFRLLDDALYCRGGPAHQAGSYR